MISFSAHAEVFRQPNKELQEPETYTADGKISNKIANEYFNNCMKQKAQGLDAHNQELLCGCTAVEMQNSMSMSDLQNLGKTDETGLAARNKMVMDVYAPCIQYPVSSLVKAKCLQDNRIGMYSRNARSLCECAGVGVGSYLHKNARDEIAKAFAENPQAQDPLGALMNSQAFTNKAQQILMGCVAQTQR